MDKLTIVGAGRVGKTLGRLWKRSAAFEISGVYDTCERAAREAVEFIGCGEVFTSVDEVCVSDAIMISVPDDQIRKVSEELFRIQLPKGRFVFHLSGYHTSEVFESLISLNCHVASVHPVKTFANPVKAVQGFSGTPCAGEGDESALSYLKRAFESIGGDFFQISRDKKRIYHSGTVFLSNYVVALLKAGTDLLKASEITDSHIEKMVKVLSVEALDNSIKRGLESALTGPVSRGDLQTVAGEVAELRKLDTLHCQLYKLLGSVALSIVEESALLDEAKTAQIRAVLEEGDF
ncbi:Ketopantoate reductase PanG [Chitinispirillum alkaliphilum]|nr:Ketopantoate reductase PanG [Chitinispirillum alkaliphilum]